MSIPRISSYAMPSQLPSNRVAWQLDSRRAVLLIHDMQQYFLDFYDRSAAPIPSLLAHIAQLRQACDLAGVPVVYSAQPQQQSPAERGLLQEWWGPGLTAHGADKAQIVAPLAPRQLDHVVTKWRYSAFVRTDLAQRMQQQGRDQLIICGVYAHIGCLMTSGDAFMQDIQSFVVGDALADFSLEQHQMGMDYVAQRCGVVHSTQQVCSALASCQVLPQSMLQLQAQVAALLDIPFDELAPDDDVLLAGMDSLRLMSLLEGWRRAGSSCSLQDLAAHTTVAAWWQVLQEFQLAARS